MISFALRMFVVFRPHLMVVFCLNSPFVVSLVGHSGKMQGMDKKHDGHAWCVKMTNIKNNFNLTFWRACCLGHLQCRNDGYNFFLLNKCRNEITRIGDVVHDLQGGHFAPSPPFCKISNNATF